LATKVDLLTAEDLYSSPSDRRGELVNGVFIDMAPPGVEHGGVVGNVAWLLGAYVRPRRLGRVLVGPGCVLRRNPDTVRAPDVSFIRADRIPPGGLSRRFREGAPDLVVEVIAPPDTRVEVETKLREWIEAEARLVWLLYPETRRVQAARSLLDRVLLTTDQILDGGDVLPGFSIRVAELFE